LSAAAGNDGWPFSLVQRVRFGDLDANRHLNNVEFLRYFETARIAYMAELFPEHSPAQPTGKGFIFAECHIAYRSPARYDEEVRTYIRVGEVRRSSIKLDFEMRADGDARLLAEGWGALVGYDYEAGSARPLPDALRARLEALVGS
jgi:acyl-CoA thioester hydrolase